MSGRFQWRMSRWNNSIFEIELTPILCAKIIIPIIIHNLRRFIARVWWICDINKTLLRNSSHKYDKANVTIVSLEQCQKNLFSHKSHDDGIDCQSDLKCYRMVGESLRGPSLFQIERPNWELLAMRCRISWKYC
jgi:hypothetical protein